MEESRGPWYLLTGVVIGLALGLVYAWGINPVAYVNTAPGSLASNYKEAYRSLIAGVYAANGNLERARIRLSLLSESNPAESLAAQAQSLLGQGGSQEDARRLALLAAALGKTPPPVGTGPYEPPALGGAADSSPTSTLLPSTQTPTPELQPVPSSTTDSTRAVSTITPLPRASLTLTPLPSPSASATPQPTVPSRTPTPTLGAPFVLKDRQPVCDPSLPEALLQVKITDAAGNPVPGIQIQVTWQGGEDFFFTGLKPEMAEGSQAVSNLTVPDCGHPGGANYWGGWLLVFTQ
jgi:hypothetical protein